MVILKKRTPINEEKIEENHLFNEFNFNIKKNNFSSSDFEGFRNNEIFSLNIESCLVCHQRNKDSCRGNKGDQLKNNNLGGCPISMHISEGILLKKEGFHLASLMIFMVNNPLCILTGYRICNDCNNACIFEKSSIEGVDVSSIESRILFDIIYEMDFGIEIYFFFLLFNPIYLFFEKNKDFFNAFSIKSLKYYEKKHKSRAAVIGSGAAGISMAFYLFVREKISVSLFDSINIDFSHQDFTKYLKRTIKNGKKLIDAKREKLGIKSGFGGVCSYGITNRWNKNYLDILLIFFKRLEYSSKLDKSIGDFKIQDSLFFSEKYGVGLISLMKYFDAFIFATGASKQKWPLNSMNLSKKSKNIFFAADFLMSKNLGYNSSINQLFLEDLKNRTIYYAVIIGFGLTAVDTISMLIKNYIDLLKNNPFFNNLIKENNFDENLLFLQKIGFRICIIYNKDLESSSANKTNRDEIVQLLVYKDILDFYYNSSINDISTDNKIHKIKLNNLERGVQINSKYIFIATGFCQNDIIFLENYLDFNKIQEFILLNKNIFFQNLSECLDFESLLNDFSSDYCFSLKNLNKLIGFVGDSNYYWRGSVIKAISSSKLASSELGKKINIYDNNKEYFYSNLSKFTIKNFNFIDENIELNIYIKKSNSFMFLKFEYGLYFRVYINSISLYLTPIDIKNDEIRFIILNKKKEFFFQKKPKYVKISGPYGDRFDLVDRKNWIFFLESEFDFLSKIILFKKLINFVIFVKNEKLYNFIKKINKNIIVFLYKINLFGCLNFYDDNLNIFISSSTEENKSKIISFFKANYPSKKLKIFFDRDIKIGCSMKGLCGKCIIINPEKPNGVEFLCSKPLICEP